MFELRKGVFELRKGVFELRRLKHERRMLKHKTPGDPPGWLLVNPIGNVEARGSAIFESALLFKRNRTQKTIFLSPQSASGRGKVHPGNLAFMVHY